MEQDQRLTPLPKSVEIQTGNNDYPPAYSSYYDDESFANKRSIRQYFNVIYKRLPIIVAITILVTAIVSLYSFRQPSIYQATTEMIIEPRKPQVTQKEAININFGNDSNYYNTQLLLLQNPDLMKKVVVALGLHRDASLLGDQNRGILATIRSMFSGGSSMPEGGGTLPIISESETATNVGKVQLTPEEDALASKYAGKLLGAGLKVERVEDTNLVNVSVTNENPVLAAKVADKLAEIFILENQNRELEGAQNAFDELSKSIEDLKITIAKREGEYIDEMSRGGLPLQEKGGDLRAGNLQALQTEYNEAQSESGKIQALYSAAIAAAQKGDILSVVGDNKALQDARSQNLKRQADLEKRIEEIDKKIDEARENRKKLLTKYTEEHPSVIEVTAQINELDSQKTRVNNEVASKIKTESQKLEKGAEREVLATLKAQYDAARQREDRTRQAFIQAAEKANVEGQAETRLVTVKREIETNRSLLDTYTQRQKEQELAITGGRPNNIKVSNKAVTPSGPIGPYRTRNIIVAMLVSFAAGIGLAFLMDYLDDSVKSSEDVSRHLGLPTLALIPHHIQSERRKLALTQKNGESTFSPAALITLEERNSPTAEAYRHLRTSLLFSSAGKPPQTILVTSSQPSEGKTTTAINTAITLAQSDVDVVIIDCDLRRPRLHSHFGLDNAQGLTNYLSGEKSTENMIKASPDLPRLKIITSGPIPPNPAELLSSNEMKNLLQFLRGRFKHIIIDSPPALSFTDAAILSTVVDGVVLVAMSGKSSIHLMRQFKQRLANIGARIYGVVLNGIKSGSMEYDYYGTGYYDYYKRSDSDTATPIMGEGPSIHDSKD
ncbi:MAG: polysaccharide biosynthesis tyrosine autokinase [Pyrinomonadaceae bacterium]|nr:polysaccharide biosynthesis tyrosine autokinase [Pyrinomonadaceae bacterium]MBP6212927.1 polysaccharide biosynthesis tyrosine autokinase [Pyrinomonadaceae bacterium]